MQLGDSLSTNQHIDFLTAQSPEELRAQIRALRSPNKIIGVYAVGSSHVAWIVPMFPDAVEQIKKRGRPPLKRKTELNNG